MAVLAGERSVPVVLMANMRDYQKRDIVSDVLRYLAGSIDLALTASIAWERIIVDPGIGFGKTTEQNVELIAKLDQLALEFAEFPILIGTSRKSFIGKLLDNAPADQRLHGTIASVVGSVLKGAHIVRVHDVKAAVEATKVADAVVRTSKVKTP